MRGSRRPQRRVLGAHQRGRIDDLVAELGDLLGAVHFEDSDEESQSEQQGAVIEPREEVELSDGREEEQPPKVELADSYSGQVPSGSAAGSIPPIIPVAEPARDNQARPDGWFSWADDVESDLFR